MLLVDPTGEEYGWQAKFFTSQPSGNNGQVDSSVSTALEKHPRLVEYTLCMAADRPDPRIQGQRSFLYAWNEHVAKWNGWAFTKGMKLQFRYWGTHEILERLSREEHAGRYFFWFSEQPLSPPWFERRLQEVLASVGPRYTPEVERAIGHIGLVRGALSVAAVFLDVSAGLWRDREGMVERLFANHTGECSGKLAKLDRKLSELIVTREGSRKGHDCCDRRDQLDRDAAEVLVDVGDVDQSLQDISSVRASEKTAKEAREKADQQY